jgi:hypothetical protein
MSYEITFDPESADEEAYQLASGRGWPDFCRWAGGFDPSGYPDLIALCNAGYAGDAGRVAAQLEHALAVDPPAGAGVASTAAHLLGLLAGRDGPCLVTM